MPITFDHTRIRVSNLEKSIDWYCQTCGFTGACVAPTNPPLATSSHTYKSLGVRTIWSSHYSPDYEVKVPEDLVHTCIRVDDIVAYCDMLEGLDLELDLWPSNWREKFVDGKKMAFITDPDGYEVEILEH